ncbi:MAG: hypothetical protein AAGL89_09685 [Pseudomonadota bacterium]
MSIGYHDSVRANGERIRRERQRQQLSREALVEISERSFSEKTLSRAEASDTISKEKISAIADALGVPFESLCFGASMESSQERPRLCFHHWDDESRELLSITTILKILVEKHFSVQAERRKYDSPASNQNYEILTHPDVGFSLHYIFYDNFSDFLSTSTTVISSGDTVILDLMNFSGLGRLVSDGLSAALSIEGIISRDNIVFYTAAPNILEMAGEHFDGTRIISKENTEEFERMLIEKVVEFHCRIKEQQ